MVGERKGGEGKRKGCVMAVEEIDAPACDLNLDSMTFIYDLKPYFLEIRRICKYQLPTLSVSKVIVWQTDRVSEQFLNGTSAHIRLFSAIH